MPHIHEKIDFTVEVFIVYQNKVLLRKHDKYNIWLSVGGHINLNEDPIQAAIREVKEEVGLDIKLADDLLAFKKQTDTYRELIPPKFLNRHRINDSHEHVTLIYFATSSTDKVNIPEPEKSHSVEWKWFTKEELDKNTCGIHDDIIFYANRTLRELSK